METRQLYGQNSRGMTLQRKRQGEAGRKEILMPDTPIDVDYPEAVDLRLRIALGACRLRAEPGEGEAWITGICHDPTGKRVPRMARTR